MFATYYKSFAPPVIIYNNNLKIISFFKRYTRYCLHFIFNVKLICILLLLAYEDVTVKFVKPINRKCHTTTCPHRKKANAVKTNTANLLQRDKQMISILFFIREYASRMDKLKHGGKHCLNDVENDVAETKYSYEMNQT